MEERSFNVLETLERAQHFYQEHIDQSYTAICRAAGMSEPRSGQTREEYLSGLFENEPAGTAIALLAGHGYEIPWLELALKYEKVLVIDANTKIAEREWKRQIQYLKERLKWPSLKIKDISKRIQFCSYDISGIPNEFRSQFQALLSGKNPNVLQREIPTFLRNLSLKQWPIPPNQKFDLVISSATMDQLPNYFIKWLRSLLENKLGMDGSHRLLSRAEIQEAISSYSMTLLFNHLSLLDALSKPGGTIYLSDTTMIMATDFHPVTGDSFIVKGSQQLLFDWKEILSRAQQKWRVEEMESWMWQSIPTTLAREIGQPYGRAFAIQAFVARKPDNVFSFLDRGRVILSEEMPDILFRRGDRTVLFPKEILQKLHHMVGIARKLQIELAAQLMEENGRITDIIYPDKEEIILVIHTDYENKIKDIGYHNDVVVPLSHLRRGALSAKKINLSEIEEVASILERYQARLIFTNSDGSKSVYRDEGIRSLLGDEQELSHFLALLTKCRVLATEWADNFWLQPPPGLDHTHPICIHNHPNQIPSPPSLGDHTHLFMYGSFGHPWGLIVETPEGNELFVFYENDSSRKEIFEEIYHRFWKSYREQGGKDLYSHPYIRSGVLEDLQRLAMKPNLFLSNQASTPKGMTVDISL